jgi:hypothetical protein
VYIAVESFAIPVLEYDATSEIGRKMLPEPPMDVSYLLKPGTVQALEGIVGHKFKRPFYLAQVLVSRPFPSLSIHLYSTSILGRQTERHISIKAQAAKDSASLATVS